MTEPVVTVEGLTAWAGDQRIVDDVSFTLLPGRVLALVGASGSGKTTTGLALLGERKPGVRLEGQVTVHGRVGYVPQDPASVLNPARRVGAVLAEIAGRSRVRDALRRAQLDDVRGLLRRYPHQLSGGQQQRLVLAQLLAYDPAVVVVDEPTTGQDEITRAEVVKEFRALAERGIGIVLISHDLDVVRELTDDVLVMRAGRVVERGLPRRVAGPPPPAERDNDRPVALSLRGVNAGPLVGIDLDVRQGECVALVGRSGSGKTTLGRCIAGLRPPEAGTIRLHGEPLPRRLQQRSRERLAQVQYVFQDARASFAPYWPVAEQVARTAVRLHGVPAAAALRRAVEVAGRMGLPASTVERTPPQLSGGELQRAALARALLARPDVLICDEITSGLDAVTQEGILDLLDDLRTADGVTLIVISHDASVVTRLADRVLVLRNGQVCPMMGAESGGGDAFRGAGAGPGRPGRAGPGPDL